ncbi:MAG: hypothetical protein N2Z69_03460, partial [Methylophilaceae bacterium]|nr:hypothetical protein [Methylophilaceae bacterium]
MKDRVDIFPPLGPVSILGLAIFLAAVLSSGQSHAAIGLRSASSAAAASGPLISITAATGSYAERNNCGSITPSIPAGSVGDLLIAQVIVRDKNATASMSGWNILYSATSEHTKHMKVYLFWRSATGSDGNTITQSGSSCNHFMGRITRFSNVDISQPLEIEPLPPGNASSQNASSVTTGTQNVTVLESMLVAATFVANDRTVAQSDGFTEIYDIADNTGRDASFSLNYRIETTTGTKGPFTWSLSGSGLDGNVGVLFAVRPSPSLLPSLTISKPAGTVTNDVMVATITARPRTVVITPPAGWTLLQTHQSTNTDAASIRMNTYYKVAGASEPASYTWTFGGSSHAGASGGIVSFFGVDTASPINVSGGNTTSNGSNHTANSISTTMASTMLVSSLAFPGTPSDWAPPSGMTEAVDVASHARPNVLGISLEMNYKIHVAAGATGNQTASAAPSGTDAGFGVAHILALKPLADHYAISHGGSGTNCQVQPVTITAHDVNHNPVIMPNNTTTLVLSTSTGQGDWSLVSGGGTFSNGTAGDGIATY